MGEATELVPPLLEEGREVHKSGGPMNAALGIFLRRAAMKDIANYSMREPDRELGGMRTRRLTGVDVADGLSMSMIQSFVWVHPVVLALLWAHEVVHCTRMPVAEIDRGTIDVLLGLPLSRRQVYLAETAVWLTSGMLLLAATLAGHLLGRLSIDPEQRVGVGRLFLVLVNLYGVYVAVGGAAIRDVENAPTPVRQVRRRAVRREGIEKHRVAGLGRDLVEGDAGQLRLGHRFP